MAFDLKEAVHLYEEKGWSLTRIAVRFHVAWITVRRKLEAGGIEIRSQGRPRISEDEWARRRKIAIDSSSWAEYGSRIGVAIWKNPSIDVRHGVRLGCRECRRLGVDPLRPSTGWIPSGRGRISVCAEHRRELLRKKKGER